MKLKLGSWSLMPYIMLALLVVLQACGGGSGGGGGAPANLTVTASSTTDIKTVKFDWNAISGATIYKLFVNPDGASGFTLLKDNLTSTGTTITVPVHLTDWVNATYLLEAHNGSGKLKESSPVSITSLMLSSIGYIKASNTEIGDDFGVAISISADGNTLAVAAGAEDSNATGISTDGTGEADNTATTSGAVYIYSRNASVWSQQAYIKASNTEISDGFGSISISLSADGNTLAVGAIGEDSNANAISTNGTGEADNTASNAGAAYVFSRSGSTWTQQAYIKASNSELGDKFGWSVALSNDGNTLAVSAILEDSNATGISINGTGEADNTASDSGAVYVYSRSGSAWTQQAYVKASNTGATDQFGRSISVSADGNTLAVGTRDEDSNATGVSTDGTGEADNTAANSGAVYVYSRSGTTWTQQAYVKASNTDANDRFGNSVSVSADGNTLAVGANGEDSNATGISTDGTGEADNTAINSGAVYVYSRSGTAWSQQAYIKASNTEANDDFGFFDISISADGNILAVGANYEDSNVTGVTMDGSGEADNTVQDTGAVYIYKYNGSAWSQQTYVKASTTDTQDRLGMAISLSSDGSVLAIGANNEDSNATGINGNQADDSDDGAGAVYLY